VVAPRVMLEGGSDDCCERGAREQPCSLLGGMHRTQARYSFGGRLFETVSVAWWSSAQRLKLTCLEMEERSGDNSWG
jgi:hypothetical protein